MFSVVFSPMLSYAFRADALEINIRYRIDGKLFNLKMLKTNAQAKYRIIKHLLCADGSALSTCAELDL